MKQIFCKIFWHSYKTETENIEDNWNVKTINFKDTCRICWKIEKQTCTSFEWPTITINK